MDRQTTPGVEQREAAIFALALEKPRGERTSFLRAACGPNQELLDRINALLAVHDCPEGPLGSGTEAALPFDRVRIIQHETTGQMIGRYKLLEKVGEGGCGVVYVAEQTEPVRRRVALKVIKLGMDTKAVVSRFEAERQALALMDHPNIAKVLDAGATETGRPYFVMELVRGIRITDYCDQNNLSTRERLGLFIKICHAIQHAHQKGIVHRDIKPTNILVTMHDGVPVPKVIDFGIAKATEGRLTDATVYTQLHQFIGTPAYMSPEQAEMSGLDIDTRSDIYSLGVLLYELLTGRTPFDPKELMSAGLDEMRRTIREREPQRPSTRLTQELAARDIHKLKRPNAADDRNDDGAANPSIRRLTQIKDLIPLIRGDLDWIVMKCLEKDRTRRYETATGVAADIKRHLENEPVHARPPSAAYKFHKAWRRNKLVFSAATAVAVALVAGLALAGLGWRQAQAERDAALGARAREEAQRKKAEFNEEKARVAKNGEAESRRKAQAQEAEARRMAYASDMSLAFREIEANNVGHAAALLKRHRPGAIGTEDDITGWEWRHLWQLCKSDTAYEYAKQPNGVIALRYNAAAHLLAAFSIGGEVTVWNGLTRKRVANFTLPYDFSRAPILHPVTGRILYAVDGPGGAIVARDIFTGAESVLFETGSEVRLLEIRQDGKQVAALGRDGSVTIWDEGQGTRHLDLAFDFTITSKHAGALAYSENGQVLFAAGTSLVAIDPPSAEIIYKRPSGIVSALAPSPDRNLIAVAVWGGLIELRNANDGSVLATLSGHAAWVSNLHFLQDGRHLLSASADQTVRLWDTVTGKQIRQFNGHGLEVYGLAFSEEQRRIFSSGKDGAVLEFDLENPSSSRAERVVATDVGNFTFAHNSRFLAIKHYQGEISIFDLETESLRAIPNLQPASAVNFSIKELAFSSDDRVLYVAGRDGSLSAFDLSNQHAHQVLPPNPVRFQSVFALPAAREVIGVRQDGRVVVFDETSGSIRQEWQLPQSFRKVETGAVAGSLKGDRLIFGNEHGDLLLTRMDGSELSKRKAHQMAVYGLTFVGDRTIASASSYGDACTWTVPELTAGPRMRGALLGLHGIAATPDHKRVLVASGEGVVKIWDWEKGFETGALRGEDLAGQVDVSNDGRFVAVGHIPGIKGGILRLCYAPSWEEIRADEERQQRRREPVALRSDGLHPNLGDSSW